MTAGDTLISQLGGSKTPSKKRKQGAEGLYKISMSGVSMILLNWPSSQTLLELSLSQMRPTKLRKYRFEKEEARSVQEPETPAVSKLERPSE